MDKIEKIRAEIERLKGQLIRGACAAQIEMETNCKDEAYNEVLAFLDTLSEEPDKSLVEEVKRYYSDNFAYISSDQPTLSILTNVARHFAEWQKEQMTKEWLKDRDECFWDGVNEGKKAMKQQMMKDAVEGEAEELYNDGESQCIVGVGTYFKPGERVYVLKAEED